jgi:hypothetical protein
VNELPLRSSAPPAIPQIDPESAKARHRDGMSCVTLPAYTYDANGHGRWCADCGAPLGEQSWVEGGADVPDWALGAVIAALGLVLALVVSLVAMGGPGTNGGGQGGIDGPRPPVVTPETIPWPEWTPHAAGSLPLVPSVP